MYPILIDYGPFVLSSWHAFFFIAAVVSFFLTLTLTQDFLSDLDSRLLFVITYLGGYFGARLASVFIDQEIFEPSAIVQELVRFGPMTSFGGLMGGFLSGSLFVILRKGKGWPTLYGVLFDRLVKVGVLAIGIGRIGCFLNGDDYGAAVADQLNPPWWSVRFPNHGDDAEYLIPVQIIELLFCSAVFAFFTFAERNEQSSQSSWASWLRNQKGTLGTCTAVVYCAGRILIEFLRDDPRGGLSYSGAFFYPAQIWSAGVIVSGLTWIYLKSNKKP